MTNFIYKLKLNNNCLDNYFSKKKKKTALLRGKIINITLLQNY